MADTQTGEGVGDQAARGGRDEAVQAWRALSGHCPPPSSHPEQAVS